MPSTKKPYRKLTRLGKYVYYLTLPPDIIRELGWRERQKLVVKKKGKGIAITDWTKS